MAPRDQTRHRVRILRRSGDQLSERFLRAEHVSEAETVKAVQEAGQVDWLPVDLASLVRGAREAEGWELPGVDRDGAGSARAARSSGVRTLRAPKLPSSSRMPTTMHNSVVPRPAGRHRPPAVRNGSDRSTSGRRSSRDCQASGSW